jgi:hypothetical protein
MPNKVEFLIKGLDGLFYAADVTDFQYRLNRVSFETSPNNLKSLGGTFSTKVKLSKNSKRNGFLFAGKTSIASFGKFNLNNNYEAVIKENGSEVARGVFKLQGVSSEAYEGVFFDKDSSFIEKLEKVKMNRLGYVDNKPTWLVPFDGAITFDEVNDLSNRETDFICPTIIYNNTPVLDYLDLEDGEIWGEYDLSQSPPTRLRGSLSLPNDFDVVSGFPNKLRMGLKFNHFPPALYYRNVIERLFKEVGLVVDCELFYQDWFNAIYMTYEGSKYLYNWRNIGSVYSFTPTVLQNQNIGIDKIEYTDEVDRQVGGNVGGTIELNRLALPFLGGSTPTQFWIDEERFLFKFANIIKHDGFSPLVVDKCSLTNNFNKEGSYLVPSNGVYKIKVASQYESIHNSFTQYGGGSGGGGSSSTQLGTAYDFSVLSAAAVTTSGALMSCNWWAGGTVAGAVSIGSSQHYANSTYAQAMIDLNAAYNYYKGLTPTGNIYVTATSALVATSPNFSGDIGGLRFTAGVFFAVAAITNSTTVTFDAQGNPAAQFVIQINAAFAAAAAANMVLINGAQSSNIFWAVTGAPSLGAAAHLEGTVIGLGAFTAGVGASINGRVMTVGVAAITLSNNVITTTAEVIGGGGSGGGGGAIYWLGASLINAFGTWDSDSVGSLPFVDRRYSWDDNVLVVMRKDPNGRTSEETNRLLFEWMNGQNKDLTTQKSDVIAYFSPKRWALNDRGVSVPSSEIMGSPYSEFNSVVKVGLGGTSSSFVSHELLNNSIPKHSESYAEIEIEIDLIEGDLVEILWVSLGNIYGEVSRHYSANPVFDHAVPVSDMEQNFGASISNPLPDPSNLTSYYSIDHLCGEYDLDLAQNLPNISGKDFISSFIKQFNLHYKVNDGTISFYPVVRYYENEAYDITSRVDVSKKWKSTPIESPKSWSVGYRNDKNDRLLNESTLRGCNSSLESSADYANIEIENENTYSENSSSDLILFSATKFLRSPISTNPYGFGLGSFPYEFTESCSPLDSSICLIKGFVLPVPSLNGEIILDFPSVQSKESFKIKKYGNWSLDFGYSPRLMYNLGTANQYTQDYSSEEWGTLIDMPRSDIDYMNLKKYWFKPTVSQFDGENENLTGIKYPTLRYDGDSGLYLKYFENLLELFGLSEVLTLKMSVTTKDWNQMEGSRRIKFLDQIYRLMSIKDYDVNKRNLSIIKLLKEV